MRHLLIVLFCLLSPALLAHDGMRMEMPKGPELGASAAFDSHGLGAHRLEDAHGFHHHRHAG
ncbi:exo-alpha-sialidase, partial [Rhodanobacter denitrificans]|nr:exo-alpha-sialidase [Rhodanobacter denitrificans]